MNDVQTSDAANYIAGLEGSVDPDPDIYNTSPEQSVVAALLTDGQQGLDFTSGIFNHPAGTQNSFVLSSEIEASAWNDDEPDVLFAQLGKPGIEEIPLTLVDSDEMSWGN